MSIDAVGIWLLGMNNGLASADRPGGINLRLWEMGVLARNLCLGYGKKRGIMGIVMQIRLLQIRLCINNWSVAFPNMVLCSVTKVI